MHHQQRHCESNYRQITFSLNILLDKNHSDAYEFVKDTYTVLLV